MFDFMGIVSCILLGMMRKVLIVGRSGCVIILIMIVMCMFILIMIIRCGYFLMLWSCLFDCVVEVVLVG